MDVWGGGGVLRVGASSSTGIGTETRTGCRCQSTLLSICEGRTVNPPPFPLKIRNHTIPPHKTLLPPSTVPSVVTAS